MEKVLQWRMEFAPPSIRPWTILESVIEDTVVVRWMTLQLTNLVSYIHRFILFISSCTLPIEKDITSFLAHYRASFPHATILPKMHILEDHVIPWLRKWHVGAGLMGEQGAESLHAHLHILERNYSGIPNDLDRLKHTFNMYNIETSPQLLELRPEVKKRKLELD